MSAKEVFDAFFREVADCGRMHVRFVTHIAEDTKAGLIYRRIQFLGRSSAKSSTISQNFGNISAELDDSL